MRPITLITAVLFISACSAPTDVEITDWPAVSDDTVNEPDPILPADLTDSRFSGTWLIEETVAHATYFASQWHFAPDGTVTMIEEFSFDMMGYPSVGSLGDGVSCSFGDTWTSDDDITLTITGDCSDQLGRDIDITLPADATGNVVTVSPVGLTVGGDTENWEGPSWGWHFVKCEGDHSNCNLQF